MIKGKIRDRTGRILATVKAERKSDLYECHIESLSSDRVVMSLFTEFETAVNGQMLFHVERLELEIEALRPTFFSDSGDHFLAMDLQVFPSQEMLSFRPAKSSSEC